MINYTKTILLILSNLFVFISFPSYVISKHTLKRGSSLTVKDDFLTSPDKTFSCGFYTIAANTNAYYLSIWFSNSKERTIVWTANRDKPVNKLGSRLSLRRNGVMVLTDYDGATAWETNTTALSVDQAELLDTGNFVLKDRRGNILWQSFDFPVNTLLPNQLFSKSTRLVSKKGPLNFGSGFFSFFFDSDNVLKLIYDGPEISSIYWPDITLKAYQIGRTNYNNSRIAMFDEMGSFWSSDQLQFSVSDLGNGTKRRLTLDYDGNLRVYSLNELSGSWYVTWQAVAKPCDIHGMCGENGICVYTPKPKCSCPPQFEPSDPSDWSKGCKPKFLSSCSDSEFVQITHVDYYGFDLNRSQPTSYEDCKQFCLGDCRCLAFNYRLTGEGMCFTKNSLNNGFRSVDFPSSMYLRVPRSSSATTLKLQATGYNVSNLNCGNKEGRIVELPNTYDTAIQRFKWIYIYVFACVIGALEVVLLVAGWWFLFKNGVSTSMEDGYRAVSNQFRSFSYNELKIATKSFKEVLGRGGFGAVYKGTLEDERVIAVKQLENVVQGEQEFWAEVSTISKINHMNLARMWGFCSEKKHKLLVYEHVENGSLDKHLFSAETILGWKERFKVALGTAKGLAYLHHECLEWVIHCDVKPENILLDGDFNAKISDFGLAKLHQRGGNGSSESIQIRGTKGYMAPEWAMNLTINAKVDVYSYGVVILELVKGIRLSSRVVDDHVGTEEISELARFVKLARSNMQNEEYSWVDDLMDPRLEGKFNRNEAAVMIEVGLSCVEDDRNKRPTMESVAQALAECEEEILMHIPSTL